MFALLLAIALSAAVTTRAAAEMDLDLAAALVSVNDATASDRRSFSSTELAEVVMGSEHRMAQEFMGN